MAVSISRIGSVGAAPSFASVSGVTNNRFNVSNESQVSAAYKQRVSEGAAADGVELVNPVVYPNAHVQAANKVKQVEGAIAADKAYNDLADKFSGVTTSYDAGSQGQAYSQVGQHVDLYA